MLIGRPHPDACHASLADQVAFYPATLECYVAGERLRPQAGGFYGAWITDEIVGPYEEEPRTGDW
jgi:hypothetical protein